MNIAKSSRELAILCLVTVEDKRQLVSEAMASLRHKLDRKSMAFANEMIMGTLRFEPGLKSVVTRYAKRWSPLPPACRWLLLCSTYQILAMRSPDYAVIDEANFLARRFHFHGLKGLVNAVLRRIAKEGPDIWASMSPTQQVLNNWLGSALRQQFGQQGCERIAQAWCRRPKLAGWLKGDSAQRGPLPFQRDVDQVHEALEQGLYLQNASSQAICELVRGLQPARVLDLCAAPGGKSLYLAAFGQADLVATDRNHNRLDTVRINAARLGLQDRIELQSWDELSADPPFDLVLVDAPCSALGILGRHPEIKIHRLGTVSSDFKQRQKELLEHAWSLTADQGYLLYSVCSWDPEEVPPWPAAAELCSEELRSWADGLSFVEANDQGFCIEPSDVYDGFRGVLLKKRSV